MKKAIKLMALMLFVATLTTMVSCSKENRYETRIVGTWQCIESSMDYVFFEGEEYQFLEDGTFKRGEMATLAAYQIDDNRLTISFGFTFSFQIEELTSTKMILSLTYGEGVHYVTLKKL